MLMLHAHRCAASRCWPARLPATLGRVELSDNMAGGSKEPDEKRNILVHQRYHTRDDDTQSV